MIKRYRNSSFICLLGNRSFGTFLKHKKTKDSAQLSLLFLAEYHLGFRFREF